MYPDVLCAVLAMELQVRVHVCNAYLLVQAVMVMMLGSVKNVHKDITYLSLHAIAVVPIVSHAPKQYANYVIVLTMLTILQDFV